jgi:pSer/pThr/pTyr-binding forkhead associated (FHA) protein
MMPFSEPQTRHKTEVMARLILKSVVFPDGQLCITTDDLPVTLGRSHRADIAINDLLLSRIHSEIRLAENGGFELMDRDSTNLTIVNDVDIDRVVLKTGDQILLGDTELFVEVNMPEAELQEKTTREIPIVDPSTSHH